MINMTRSMINCQLHDHKREQLPTWPSNDSLLRQRSFPLQHDVAENRMRTQTIGERFAHERALPAPLPVEPFEIGRLLTPRVNMRGQISVRTNRYSVPIRLSGHQVRVMLFASHLVVYHKGVEVAQHELLLAEPSGRLITQAVGGQSTPNRESREVRWVPRRELDNYCMHRSMRLRINHYLQGDSPHIT